MKKWNFIFSLIAVVYTSCNSSQANYNSQNTEPAAIFEKNISNNKYCWIEKYDDAQSIEQRIKVPEGYQRIKTEEGSFADWLRYLPVIKGKPDVYLYNGNLKENQTVHEAVIDIDVGNTDLQQCADAVMRMRGEYLFSKNKLDELHFNFTSGDIATFKKWSDGYRPVIKGNSVKWNKTASKDESHKNFREYMNTVFTYAGTLSLSKELKSVAVKDMQIGDVFIFGGSPGHAVLIVDMAENIKTGEKLFLIQQSYMPAQQIHILKNYNNEKLSPWYNTSFSGDLETPEWTFKQNQLMRF